MPNREVVLDDLTKKSDLQKLRAYLRELYTLSDPKYQVLTYNAGLSADVNVSQTFFVLLTGNVTSVSILNSATGRRVRFIFLQDGTGGRTVAGWQTGVIFSGGSFTPTSTAGKYSCIDLEYQNAKWVETGRSLNVG